MSRHNEIYNTHIHLNALVSSASSVLIEPTIFTRQEDNFDKVAMDGTVKSLNGRNVKMK